MRNIFDPMVVDDLAHRIGQLNPASHPEWGRMTVDQMLAHCNVAYEMVYESVHPRPGRLKGFLLRTLVKRAVVGPRPYPHNTPTAPQFRVTARRDFANEQQRLIAYLHRVQQDGVAAFDGRISHSFGALTAEEWNVLFYKHLDHHLRQFGV